MRKGLKIPKGTSTNQQRYRSRLYFCLLPFTFCLLISPLISCQTTERAVGQSSGETGQKVVSRYDQYFAASVLADGKVWAVGQNGKIVMSQDRGQTWSTQPSHTTQSLFAVSFPEAEQGWAVGAAGTILHTTDGGTTWAAQSSGTDKDLLAIRFLEMQRGWAVGAAGVIVTTQDGGQRWQDRSLGADANLNDLYFLNSQTAWIVGEYGTVLKTTNGGDTWEQIAGKIPDTEEEGKSWEELMSAENVGAGGVNTATRGGLGEEDNLFGVYFTDENQGWATSTGGRVFLSKDGGKNWEARQTGYEAPLFAVGAACATCPLYACGGRGLVLRSTDGGNTWSEVRLAERAYSYLRDLAFLSPQELLLIGTQGTLLRTGV
jgi:photosystem II stability/assembly factor-like uncharacterized protein